MLWVLWGLALLLPHLPLSRAASRGLWLGFRPHGAHAPICISDLGGGYTEVYPARPYLAYTSPTDASATSPASAFSGGAARVRVRGVGRVHEARYESYDPRAPREAATRGAKATARPRATSSVTDTAPMPRARDARGRRMGLALGPTCNNEPNETGACKLQS